MTTIAFDGSTVCADSLISAGGMKTGYRKKIIRTSNGIVAYSGTVSDCLRLVAWIEKGLPQRSKPDLPSSADIGILWIDTNGKAWELDDGLHPIEACIPWADGSGAPYALAAMLLGKTAKQAVKLALKLDCYSGGAIQEEKVCD